MTLFMLAQIVGAIATIIFTVALFQKKQSKILSLHLLGTGAEGIMYFMQYAYGGITGGVIRCIDMVRTAIMYWYKKREIKMPKVFVFFFVAVAIAVGVYTWENIWSLFVIFPSAIYTPAMWQNNMRTTRICMLVTCICLTIYNFALAIYPAGVGLAIETVAAVVAVVRYEVMGNEHKTNCAKQKSAT